MYASIFPEGKMTSGWVEVIFSACPKTVTRFEKDNNLFGVVAISKHENDTYIINSIAKDNQRYTFAMQRMIIDFTKKHEKVIIMSTLKDSCINKFTDRFVENGEQSCFVKGV